MMQCRQCGYHLTSQTKFCPSCGTKLTDEEINTIASQSHPGRKLSFFLWSGIILLIVAGLYILFSPDATDAVRDQLNAIRNDRLTEAYYNYTSKAFQEATSLDRFREFTKTFPVVAKSHSIRFVDRKVVDDVAELHAMLETGNGVEVPIQYRLVYEGDQWKIASIKISNSVPAPTKKKDADNNKPAFDSIPIEKAVQGQVGAIRSGNLRQAYDVYGSNDFKKSTTYDEFVEYVNGEKTLADNDSISVTDLTFDNNIATLTVRLTSRNGQKADVDFDLVFENGSWKVLQIDDLPDGLEFGKFALGEAVKPNGLVIKPKEEFGASTGNLYLNLHVDNAKAGTIVEVVFEHLDSMSKIDPVTTNVADDGDAVLAFVFSPPAGGWPEGSYRLLASSSNGQTSSYDFKIKR